MEAFYILGALDNRLNYLYSIEPTLLKLLPLTPSSSSILWTLATKEKLQMQIVYTWLGKNYDKVDDGIVFCFFFWWEKWMMRLLCIIGCVWIQLLRFFFLKADFVDFLTVNNVSVHCLWTHKHHFSTTFSLKTGLTVLFTHLKIILLQYF